MKFRTEYKTARAPFTLSPDSPIVLTGSCFADNIGACMRGALWNAVNPFGVLFNPLSIANAIGMALDRERGVSRFENSLFESDGIWHSWLFDTRMSALRPDEMRRRFKNMTESFRNFTAEGKTLCVTFGTSYCYFLSGMDGYAVANCHKRPEKLFERKRISVKEICDVWNPLVDRLLSEFPALRLIFTVSPVRHVRDGLHQNRLSKATLLLAVDQLCADHEQCCYFPAYEILEDDLRDYRFYASDLVHPSADAEKYIWEIFQQTYLDERGRRILSEGTSLVARINHRPLVAADPRNELFARETERLLSDFYRRFPAALRLPEMA